jgi:hypothetical protein
LAHEVTEEACDATLDVNLKGSLLVARAINPGIIAKRAGMFSPGG